MQCNALGQIRFVDCHRVVLEHTWQPLQLISEGPDTRDWELRAPMADLEVVLELISSNVHLSSSSANLLH